MSNLAIIGNQITEWLFDNHRLTVIAVYFRLYPTGATYLKGVFVSITSLDYGGEMT